MNTPTTPAKRHHYTVTGICYGENEYVAYWTTATDAKAAREIVEKRGVPECDDLCGPVFRGWLVYEVIR